MANEKEQAMNTQQQKMKTFKEGVKLIALLQASLEQMDNLKGTALYKQSLKKLMNTLELKIEQAIRQPLTALDNENDELLTKVQMNIEMVMGLELEELAMLRGEIDDFREDSDPFGEHFEINSSSAQQK